MKKILFLISFLLLICPCFATTTTGNINKFKDYRISTSSVKEKISFLKKFVGDTVTFDFSNRLNSDLFSKQDPDTIWLKKRPKKNPQEGKHYNLSYVYKGISFDNKIVTPVNEINNKPFAILRVESQKSNKGYYSIYEDLILTLVDLDDLSLVYFLIPQDLTYNFSMKSKKLDRMANSVKGEKLYMNAGSGYSANYQPVTIEDVNYEIVFENDKYSSKYLNSDVNLTIIGQSGNIIPYKNSDSYLGSSQNTFITKDEYEENYTIRKIDSKINEELLNSNIETPFDFTFILATPKNSSKYISQSIDPTKITSYSWTSDYKYAPEDLLFVGGELNVKGNKFYKMAYAGKAFFMKADDVELQEDGLSRLDSLMNSGQEVKDWFLQKTINLSKYYYMHKLEETYEELASYKSQGLAIVKWNIYDESEYTDGTGINITFYNPTQQMIKYVSITFQGYNAVDDPVGKPITKKCIGPIDPDDSASYNFEYAWFTDIIDYAKIRSITITYKNGTTKTIAKPYQIIFSDNLLSVLESSNPVENFD